MAIGSRNKELLGLRVRAALEKRVQLIIRTRVLGSRAVSQPRAAETR